MEEEPALLRTLRYDRRAKNRTLSNNHLNENYQIHYNHHVAADAHLLHLHGSLRRKRSLPQGAELRPFPVPGLLESTHQERHT